MDLVRVRIGGGRELYRFVELNDFRLWRVGLNNSGREMAGFQRSELCSMSSIVI